MSLIYLMMLLLEIIPHQGWKKEYFSLRHVGHNRLWQGKGGGRGGGVGRGSMLLYVSIYHTSE